MTYRNRRFLDMAHDMHECTIQAPGCIGYSPDGLEPAHSNWQEEGIGIGIKSDDVFAAACHHCHMELDDRANLTRAEKIEYWQRGTIRTIRYLLSAGKLKVCP